ncbi:GH36-type glycosyl hydrolase domain-containing protein [Paremcibacter congregatus]|uniref:Uncharacterized protein n=1 Tax=Paremcibacter congregatus TaxID=2043170 RepID=A0A2G4YYJ4_9PROT|nr:hypothetical protein CRD36_01125 [Paremcibacter congregatus]
MKLLNSQGLTIEILTNGLVKSIDADSIRISLKAANPFGKLGTNLYLRRRGAPIQYKPLLGPESNSLFYVRDNLLYAVGSWDGIAYLCHLQLSEESLSWQWSVELHNTTEIPVEIDMIYLQDVGLEVAIGGRTNEYYISQYIERRILNDETYGSVICCRQNFNGPNGNPWLMIAAKGSAASASVDGMQFYGSTFKETEVPQGLLADSLTGEYSGELSILALQETPFTLLANQSHISEFVATYMPDHPHPTSPEDLKRLPALMREFNREDFTPISHYLCASESNLFSTSPLFRIDDLSCQELDLFFGEEKRHAEQKDEQLLSFFSQENNHVVLRAKEAIVERPHAHIMQTHAGYVPDENIMTTTSYMYGVFNSHITQGNTNFNRLLSVNSSQFNLETQTGQRIFVEIEGQMYRLGVPSAYEMGLNNCRWIYKRNDHCFQVRTWTSKTCPQVNMDFKVLKGNRVNLLVTNHFDEEISWQFSSGETEAEIIATPNPDSLTATKFPDAQFRMFLHGNSESCRISDDGILYQNQESRGGSFMVISVKKTSEFCMSFVGEVLSRTDPVMIRDADKQWDEDCKKAQEFWHNLCSGLSLQGNHQDLNAIREILPWYGANAFTHLLTPHGLEQFDGAAWGTRDTSQGPCELLLALRKFDAVKKILRILFSNQNTDGGWPQWWMFDSYTTHRAGSSHGDIPHWCLIALSSYIEASGDAAFLDEIMPYYPDEGNEVAERSPLSEHVDRLINTIAASFIPGTALVPFGGGDWNDSMQPVNQDLAQRLISSWTVELNYQAFMACQEIYINIGNKDGAERLYDICTAIKADFNKYLVKEGTVTGHGLIQDDGGIELLLHPDDAKTNIQYRLLPMMRGVISGIFTPEQAQHHLVLIETHLKGPDGARLMNRPPRYNGGVQTFFQRAESSPFFGREIGIMYTHAHLRYAETLAKTGHAAAFMKALRQANPVAYRDVVPCGNIRQSNCYYSSSDATFKNRYEADEKYEDLIAGKVTLKGGWRIYSSGPGIFIGLIISHFLGLRDSFGNTIIDPLISSDLNDMCASITFLGRHITFKYTVSEECCGPKSITINNVSVPFERENNQYRLGGAVIPTDKFLALLNEEKNSIEVHL